jgi:hypothetical protein
MDTVDIAVLARIRSVSFASVLLHLKPRGLSYENHGFDYSHQSQIIKHAMVIHGFEADIKLWHTNTLSLLMSTLLYLSKSRSLLLRHCFT